MNFFNQLIRLCCSCRAAGTHKLHGREGALVALAIFLALCTFVSLRNYFVMNQKFAEDADALGRCAVGVVSKKSEHVGQACEVFLIMRETNLDPDILVSSSGPSPITQLEQSVHIPQGEPLFEYVPKVAIKAIVVIGDSVLCTLDIEGEKPAQTFSRGMKFSGGKGKIISIDTGGVDWTWSGKRYRTDLE